MRLYGIKNCDTMKKAMACLDAQGTAYEFIDYKKVAGVAATTCRTGTGVPAGKCCSTRAA